MSATSARSPDTLLRPDGNSLRENYSKHDVAEEYVRERLDWYGFEAHECGIDKREADDELIYDDRPDLRVTGLDDDTTLGYVEVKSKSVEHDRWYGVLNKRHWEKYLHGGEREDSVFDGALSLDVPVYVHMSVVDDDLGIVVKECVIPVRPTVEVARTWQARDGNMVVAIDEAHYERWQTLADGLRQ